MSIIFQYYANENRSVSIYMCVGGQEVYNFNWTRMNKAIQYLVCTKDDMEQKQQGQHLFSLLKLKRKIYESK